MAVSDFTDEVEVKVFRSHVKIPVIFLVPAAMLATMYCAGYFYVNSNWFLDDLPEGLERLFGGSFAVQELVVDPTFTGARVFGAEIRREPGEEPVIDAPEAEASIEPVFLLVGRLVFDSGRAEGAHVRLAFDDEGEMNLLQAFGLARPNEDEPVPEKRPLAISFRSLEAENCSFEFVRDEFDFEIPDVDVQNISIELEREGMRMRAPEVTVPEVDFRFRHQLFGFPRDYGDWTFTVEDVEVQNWEWEGEGFRVAHVGFRAEGAQAEAEGEMSFPNDEDGNNGMRYKGRGEVSVPYWSPLVQYFVRDTVHFEVPSFEAAVDGTLEMIDGRVRAHADLLNAAGVKLTDVVGEGRLHDESIILEQGRADFYGGEVRADWAYFDMFEVAYGGEGTFRGVNPAKLLADYDIDAPALDGGLSGDFRATGAVPMGPEFDIDDPLPILTDARRNLADVEATSPWAFRRSNRLWMPVSQVQFQPGSRVLVDYERVAIPEAEIAVPGGRFLIDHFELDYDRMEFRSPLTDRAVDIRAQIDDIGPWLSGWGFDGVAGKFSGRIWANGPVSVPTAGLRATLDAPEVKIGEATVQGSRGELDLEVNRGRLDVRTLDFESTAGRLSASGALDFAEVEQTAEGTNRRALDIQPIDFHYRAEGIDLGVVDRAIGNILGASGTLNVEGSAIGSLQEPRISFAADIANGKTTWFDYSDLSLVGDWTRDQIRVEHFESAVAETGAVAGSGQYTFGGHGDYVFDLDIDNLQIERTTYVAAIAEGYRPKGQINVELHGEGSLASPSVAGDIELRNLLVGERRMGDLAVVANTVDETLYLSGAALPVGTVGFEFPLTGADRYHAKFGVEELDFARVFPTIGNLSLIEKLVATGQLEIDAAADFSDYVVSVNMTDARLQTETETIRTKGPLRASFDSNYRIQIEEATIGSRGQYLDVRGAVLLDSYLTSLKVEGELDLSLLNLVDTHLAPGMMPEGLVDSEGVVELAVDIGGPPSRPIPSGHLAFRDAVFNLRDFPEPLRVNRGRIQFDPDQIVVPADDEIEGEFMGGLFSVAGRLDVEDYRPTGGTFDVWAHNLQYRVPETANVTVDTDVTVSADQIMRPETWTVSGQVEVLNALYFRDISLFERQLTGRVIGTFARRTKRFEAGLLDRYPWIGDIEFDVNLLARDGFVIKNQIDRFALDLELRLDLELQRTLVDPRVSGEIDVISGNVEFQGETFEVRTGSIEYTGNPRNPRVEITAGADIQNRCVEGDEFDEVGPNFRTRGDFDEERREIYHVMLNVEGKLNALDIQFDSNPYADQRDILSLMLTGCTVDELTASSATQPTLEIALGPLLGRIEKEVRDVVELSEFTIMPGVERTQVRIGDQLSRRLEWRFQLDTGLSERSGGQRYQLEYKLSDRWSAEVSERSNTNQENFLLDAKLKYRLPLE